MRIFVCWLLLAGFLFADEKEEMALTFLKHSAPKIHREILSLRKSDPKGYKISVEEAATAAKEYQRLLELDEPKTAAAYLTMYQIDYEAIVVADILIQSDDTTEKAHLMKELRKLIDQSFTQWAIVEKARVERLETEVASLRKDFENALSNRKKVVERDCEVLLKETRVFRGQKK